MSVKWERQCEVGCCAGPGSEYWCTCAVYLRVNHDVLLHSVRHILFYLFIIFFVLLLCVSFSAMKMHRTLQRIQKRIGHRTLSFVALDYLRMRWAYRFAANPQSFLFIHFALALVIFYRFYWNYVKRSDKSTARRNEQRLRGEERTKSAAE